MANKDTGQPANGISRRAFLTSAALATTAVGCGFDVAFDAAKALAYESSADYKVTSTTCPYCSASCGQRVVVTTASHADGAGHTVDIYGDFESPMNSGGLCAKGAGTLQLVNNTRRLGAFADNPENATFSYDAAYTDGVAYKRTGDGAWGKMTLDDAMGEIAPKLVTARGALSATGTTAYNSKGVAFFGSSHMNNESNYLYRKIIANFGTSNVEHQARI
jgi:formate dehydrogenase major subunit